VVVVLARRRQCRKISERANGFRDDTPRGEKIPVCRHALGNVMEERERSSAGFSCRALCEDVIERCGVKAFECSERAFGLGRVDCHHRRE
jgi:hypothetical protein